ncbi:hypothetical protein [Gryllotalpicola koreensis]|uniref:Phage tail protein n=1 Tax=Gryllotalpicola koreensis TaxID=993086 RepID=A0ABP7ZUP8_9MICO
MTSTFTFPDASTVTPDLQLVWSWSRDVLDIEHQLSDGTLEVTERPAGPRRGTFQAFFADETAAAGFEAKMAAPGVKAFADTDRPSYAMSFVGKPTAYELDTETRSRFTVTVTFVEVPS